MISFVFFHFLKFSFFGVFTFFFLFFFFLFFFFFVVVTFGIAHRRKKKTVIINIISRHQEDRRIKFRNYLGYRNYELSSPQILESYENRKQVKPVFLQ